MSDRRKETRRKLMAFTPVYELNPRLLLGYLGDLTLHGALVIGGQAGNGRQRNTGGDRFSQ